MKKKVFLILFVLFSFYMTEIVAENLYTLRSEHFEFIYPEESEETAVILYENAEKLYEKAASLLQTDINLFLPVYITPDTQQLNAYYTAAPYNRIVFFDTPPDTFSLSVFSNTKTSVFYHELIHAFTMNMKDGFWDFVSSLLGDIYSPSYLFTSTLSFLEGATVSFESMDGEGRLNSGDCLAYLVQAKIEDVFPGWKDASGPRDIFPASQYAYLFGGAFNRYIQKKYGMEKYSELWTLCGSGGGWNPFIDGSFKTVYGVSIEEEWSEFEKSIPVPVLADDIDVVTVNGKPSSHSAFAFRNGKEKGIAFLENGSFIKYAQVDNETGLPGKLKNLLLADGYVSDLSFSDDGRYLLITGIGTNLANSYSLKIYDMERNEYVAKAVYPLSSACLAEIPEYGDILVGAAVRSGRAYLEIRAFDDVLAHDGSAEILISEKLPVSREVYAMHSAGGKIWALEKDTGVWKLVGYELGAKDGSFFLTIADDYTFPENIVPSSLAYGGEKNGSYMFYCAVAGKDFLPNPSEIPVLQEVEDSLVVPVASDNALAETAPGALSRLLIIEIPADLDSVNSSPETEFNGEEAVSASVFLANGDVSGGMHRPFYDAETDTLYFIARKAESLDVSYCHGIPGGVAELSPVRVASCFSGSPTESVMAENDILAAFGDENEHDDASQGLVLPAERGNYNALNYLFPGAFIPAGIDLTTEEAYPVGLSWLTMDPTERFRLLVSGGWNYFTGKWGAGFRTWGGSSFLSYSLSFLTEYDGKSFSMLKGKLSLAGAVPVFTRRQEIQYSNDFLYAYESDSSRTIVDNADISYVAKYKIGKGVYDAMSFSAGISYINESIFGGSLPPLVFNNIGFHLNAGFGGLFPISAQAVIAKTSESFLTLATNVVLFSTEIQKGVPIFPLYANRFTLTGGYIANWKTYPSNMMILDFPRLITDLPSLSVKHGVTFGANFTMSPIMSLMQNFQFDIGADFTWYFANEQEGKLYDLVVCGVFTF
ncbi:MAG: hypothetical protein K5751_03765 [Treponemataceae bacterium]|nr:hypothetical protein [Treponemataceae bacterium]